MYIKIIEEYKKENNRLHTTSCLIHEIKDS